jgi:hypothetical protein
MPHLYGVQSSANTNTSATNIAAANTSSAEHCSIATDDMTLANALQNAIEAVSVVQTLTSKTAKEFEFGFCKKNSIYLIPVEYVSQIWTCCSVPYLPYSQHQQTVKEYFL